MCGHMHVYVCVNLRLTLGTFLDYIQPYTLRQALSLELCSLFKDNFFWGIPGSASVIPGLQVDLHTHLGFRRVLGDLIHMLTRLMLYQLSYLALREWIFYMNFFFKEKRPELSSNY